MDIDSSQLWLTELHELENRWTGTNNLLWHFNIKWKRGEEKLREKKKYSGKTYLQATNRLSMSEKCLPYASTYVLIIAQQEQQKNICPRNCTSHLT